MQWFSLPDGEDFQFEDLFHVCTPLPLVSTFLIILPPPHAFKGAAFKFAHVHLKIFNFEKVGKIWSICVLWYWHITSFCFLTFDVSVWKSRMFLVRIESKQPECKMNVRIKFHITNYCNSFLAGLSDKLSRKNITFRYCLYNIL